MPAQLIATKLFIPALRPEHVSRPRLTAGFDASLSHRLTLVSAPAGYGKTSLLSEWARACLYPVAWLSLDEGDNDPARFQEYLFAAFRNAGVIPDFAASSAPDLRDALAALINFINTSTSPVILVLDDYHLLTSQNIHDALVFLLDHQPEQLHLILATRADPPLPLARLRGRGQLAEIRLADLRFTDEETVQLLNNVQGLEISHEDALVLARRTEGWAAGLQMAVVAMQSFGRERNSQSVRKFVQDFSGSNRFILDYLMEEVLTRATGEVRFFLQQTAFLDRLTAGLCAEVMKEPVPFLDLDKLSHPAMDSARCQSILQSIEQANIFIIPLDPERRWYRYHPLFADLLRKRMEDLSPTAVPELHRRASSWFERQGLIEPAIEHALQAADYLHAADLLASIVGELFIRGELVNFSRWACALPEEILHTHPLLTVYLGYLLILNGASEEKVEAHLRQAEQHEPDQGTKAAILILRSFFLSMKGSTQASIEMVSQAMNDLPQEHEFFKNYGRVIMAIPYLWSGRSPEAIRIFEDALASGKRSTNILFTPLLMRRLARLYMALGQLEKAGQYLDQAISLAADPQGRPLPHAGMLLVTRGNLRREWNDLDAAEEDIRQGIEMLGQWGKTRLSDGYAFLADVLQARGDGEAARLTMQMAVDQAHSTKEYELDDIRAACFQARLWIRQGNLAAAEEWARAAGLEDDPGPAARLAGDQPLSDRLRNYMRREEYPVLARLRLAQGQADRALQLLSELLDVFEKESWVFTVLEVEILRALAFDAIGNRAACFRSVNRALELAQPGRYVRAFLDEGDRMCSILQAYLPEIGESQGQLLAYTRHLLEEFQVDTHRLLAAPEKQEPCNLPGVARPVKPLVQTQSQPETLIEPLSERELQILRMLSTYLTIPEIADELGIAPSTVRTHVKNIYGKLDVHARIDAVEQARQKHLF